MIMIMIIIISIIIIIIIIVIIIIIISITCSSSLTSGGSRGVPPPIFRLNRDRGPPLSQCLDDRRPPPPAPLYLKVWSRY